MRRALMSVSDKTGLLDFARGLQELEVELVSTGGTARELARADIAARPIEDFTGFPEIMDGRVKTLHPRLYAGLLARRDEDSHLQAAEEQGIEPVDLVIVNLYPFEQTLARGDASEQEIIENIDIGGPTMIRAAAKNVAFAAVVVDPGDYPAVLAELRENDGRLSPRRARIWPARRSPPPPATTPPSRGGSRAPPRASRPAGRRPTRRSSTCATARTPTSRAPSTPAPGPVPTCWRASISCTARSCPTTTCSTSAPHGSWSKTSTSRPARSSSTTTPVAARWRTAPSRPMPAPSPATRRAPTAA